MNGSAKTTSYRNGYDGHDPLNAIAQFKLKKGDSVNIYFGGPFYNPVSKYNAYFEGHLIRQINE